MSLHQCNMTILSNDILMNGGIIVLETIVSNWLDIITIIDYTAKAITSLCICFGAMIILNLLIKGWKETK